MSISRAPAVRPLGVASEPSCWGRGKRWATSVHSGLPSCSRSSSWEMSGGGGCCGAARSGGGGCGCGAIARASGIKGCAAAERAVGGGGCGGGGGGGGGSAASSERDASRSCAATSASICRIISSSSIGLSALNFAGCTADAAGPATAAGSGAHSSTPVSWQPQHMCCQPHRLPAYRTESR